MDLTKELNQAWEFVVLAQPVVVLLVCVLRMIAVSQGHLSLAIVMKC